MMKRVAYMIAALCLLLGSLPVNSFAASAHCPALSRTLARGMRGGDVAELQQFLVGQGLFAADSATGYFGPLTEKAVQAWQASHGIVSSGTPVSTGYGLAGPKTRAAMQAACGARQAAAPPAQSHPPVPANPECPLVALPLGKPCAGTWKEVKDAKGCTASWQCGAQ